MILTLFALDAACGSFAATAAQSDRRRLSSSRRSTPTRFEGPGRKPLLQLMNEFLTPVAQVHL
jgi:hypothetical protein